MTSNLVDAAKSFVPTILANLEQIDSEAQLPPDLSAAMAKKSLFSMYVPKCLGGPESDPITAFHVVEEISKADGSAGWCAFNGSAVTSAISRVSIETAKEIFGDPPIVKCSGSARPTGNAKVAPAGYLVSGRWNYLSGIDHSEHLFLNCNILDDDGPVKNADGSQVTRVAIVPVATGKVLDTWTTLGMRGTASNDAEFSNVFIPDHHTFPRGAAPHHESPLYITETMIHMGWTLAAANALGMARGAMNAFVQLATASGSTQSNTLLRDRSTVQTTVGECEAVIDASRTYVLDAVGEMWDAQVERSPSLTAKSVRSRLAITHAIRQSVEVVDRLFFAAGTNAIHESVGLERFFRDLHASGQHLSGGLANFEYGGQWLLGAELTAPTST